MRKAKSLIIMSIIFILLMLSLSTTCYGATIRVNLDGSEFDLEYSAPFLNAEDISEIQIEIENFVRQKEQESKGELKEETLKQIQRKIEKLIKEIEEDKIRQEEKEVLKEMEKEYYEKKNSIPKAGDMTIKVLNSIIITLTITLFAIIIFSRKRKV